MARTSTHTTTHTESRIDLLKLQVRMALRRAMNYISDETLQRVFDVGIGKKYIGEVNIYGLDSGNYCRAHLRLRVDWDRHILHIAEGRTDVTIDERWWDGASIEVDEMSGLFHEFVAAHDLKTNWQISWTPGIDYDRARAELGTVPVTPPNRRGPGDGTESRVYSLDELYVGLYLWWD